MKCKELVLSLLLLVSGFICCDVSNINKTSSDYSVDKFKEFVELNHQFINSPEYKNQSICMEEFELAMEECDLWINRCQGNDDCFASKEFEKVFRRMNKAYINLQEATEKKYNSSVAKELEILRRKLQ